MSDPIIPNDNALKDLWATYCAAAVVRESDDRRAATHHLARSGFDLWREDIRRSAIVTPPLYRVAAAGSDLEVFMDVGDTDPDVVFVTSARGHRYEIPRRNANPDHPFTAPRLAAAWFRYRRSGPTALRW